MNSSTILLACNLFLQATKEPLVKKAGIISIPIASTKRIFEWIFAQYKIWSVSKRDDITLKQEFNIDLSDLPKHYKIQKKKDKILFTIHFTKAKDGSGEAKSEAYFSYPDTQDNKCKISITIESPKKINLNDQTSPGNQIFDSLTHELRHYVQFLISRSIEDSMIVPEGYNYDQYRSDFYQKRDKAEPTTVGKEYIKEDDNTDERKIKPSDEIDWKKYYLEDLELQTTISTDFINYLGVNRKNWWEPSTVKYWIGIPEVSEYTSNFFGILAKEDFNRWKYAVKEFYRLWSDMINKRNFGKTFYKEPGKQTLTPFQTLKQKKNIIS